MAKALLFLKAGVATAELEAELRASFKENFSVLDPPLLNNVTVRLMRSPEFDPLYNTESPHVHPDLVIEVLTAPGLVFSAVEEALVNSLDVAGIDCEQSLALLMHQRVYLPHAPQPVNFHYLMLRREDLSPADYCDYYSHYHCRFGIHCPGIEGYSQNYIDQTGSQQLCRTLAMAYREVTSISEMNTPSLEVFFGSPAMMELAEPTTMDEQRFVNREQSVMFTSEVFFELGDMATIHQAIYPQHYDD